MAAKKAQKKSAAPPIPYVWTLEDLRAEAARCKRCHLCEERKQVVVPEGLPHANVVIVSDKPGKTEDHMGQPMKGAVGGYFNDLLNAVKMRREEAVITNAVMCMPPYLDNRIPTNPSIAALNACRAWLYRLLYIVDPVVVFAMGGTAAATLLGEKVEVTLNFGRIGLATIPGHVTEYHVPVVVLANPAHLRKMNDRSRDGLTHRQVHGLQYNLKIADRLVHQFTGLPIPDRGKPVATPRPDCDIPRVMPDLTIDDEQEYE